MIKYSELIETLGEFTHTDVHELIPDDFYRAVIRLAIRKSKEEQAWDIHHVAAVLLYVAFNHDKLHPSQLNASGLRALDWAELLIENENVMITVNTDEDIANRTA